MITAPQIRAARSLLDWTQAELARRTGISLRALNSIERGQAIPRTDNLHFIRQALENAGIEFGEFDGVRRQTERLEILKFEGERYFDHHMHDMMKEMRTPGSEILYSFESEDELEALQCDEYYVHTLKHKISERALIARGETWIIGPPSTYRWQRRAVFNHVGYIVYGDNVAFMIVSQPHRMIIIRNPAIADMFRRQFDASWAAAEVPWFAKDYKDADPAQPWSAAKAIATREWIKKTAEAHKKRSD